MRRLSVAVVAALAVFAAACREPSQPLTAPPSYGRQSPGAGSSTTCISPDSVRKLIELVFQRGQDRSAAMSRFNQIVKEATGSNPNISSAQHHAITLADFSLNKFHSGQLIGGTSTATATMLSDILNGMFCLVGLPPFNPASLGLDGAALVVTDTGGLVVTGTQWAGVNVPAGSVTEPTLITIVRLPDVPGPLLTQFDQYPVFYEFSYNPGQTFVIPVVVGVCLRDDVVPADPARLRLAHNIAPYTMGSIEVLAPASAPFLNCVGVSSAAGPSSRLQDLARGGFNLFKRAVLPQPLFAARYGSTGLSGSVRTFSPFGAIDTLGALSLLVPHEQVVTKTATTAAYDPAVRLLTPTGQPMAGVTVRFDVIRGTGTVANPVAVTDATGRATAGTYTLDPGNSNWVRATAIVPAGTGLTGNGEIMYVVRR